MNRLTAALVLVLATLAATVVACGRYGPPRRPAPAPPAQSAPLTDPAVPR